MFSLTVSALMLVCSQEEQFYINGNLPDFHQVNVPDIWIGLSGTSHAKCFDSHCKKKQTLMTN